MGGSRTKAQPDDLELRGEMAQALNDADQCRGYPWYPSAHVCQAREHEEVAVFPEIDLDTVGDAPEGL